ncbi:MAG TPA: glycosyltransferase [Methylomirabilota bacterium]|nr:glycosyltransferase [Methylomirabilota bacterium]
MKQTLSELDRPEVARLRPIPKQLDSGAAKRDGTATKLKYAKLSILIPAYNEEATLHVCLQAVLDAPLPAGMNREIILVDDASKDSTWLVAQRFAQRHPQVRVFRQNTNQGKGAAIRRAIAEMTGDVAIFQDADLEYDPNDYQRLLAPILSDRAEVVFGSRFTGSDRKVLYFWHTVGNRALTLLANMLNDMNLTDMETCYKVFTAEALRTLPLESNRFGIEPEVVAKVARNRFRVYEVPISYNGRTYEEGKKITWRDGLAALWFIVKYRFSSNYADAGKVALDSLEQAPRFNQWMFDRIKPYLGKRVAELGSGRGNLSRLLKAQGNTLLTDNREQYLNELNQRWGHLPTVKVAPLDLLDSSEYQALAEFQADTVVCLNVLEHIEDDVFVLQRLQQVLPPDARLAFLVPFNPKLYSNFDRELGHFRRYEKGELEAKMLNAGFAVERQFFFNKAGVIAWWVGNVLCRQRTITPWQLKLYNLLTPLFRVLDYCLPIHGLSTVVIARKP